jgi:hypothetical protein
VTVPTPAAPKPADPPKAASTAQNEAAAVTQKPDATPAKVTPPAAPTVPATAKTPAETPSVTEAKTQLASKTPSAHKSEDTDAKIKEVYTRLARGMEHQEVSSVIQCVSPQWKSAEGVTYPALMAKLRHAFRDASHVKYNIRNVKVEQITDERYKVTYDVALSSTLAKTKETREDHSQVTDEVTVGKFGRPHITRTLQGRFWPK